MSKLKEIALDIVRFGRTHDEEATRFLKSNEQRLNENFRRLKETTEEIMADFSDYYPKSEVDTLLAGKANTSHNHDSRYYKESEVDTLLSAKADVITSYGDLSQTGTTLSVAPSAVSVATATWKTVASIDLPAGRWVIFANARFASNATGYREILMSTSADDGQQTGYIFHDICGAVNGTYTYCSFSCWRNLSGTSTTQYLNVYQNSGSALNVIGRMYAVRIA